MLALVRFADERGCAFPGFAALCRGTRIGRTKLIESLAELQARGLFVRTAQTHGKEFGSNHYQLPIEPPTEGLGGDRRLVRQANQSATRTSAPAELGSPPHALGVVRQANGGSAPGEPYLLTDLPNRSAQGTTQPRAHARKRSPKKGTQQGKAKAIETSLPPDFQPTEAHRAYAQKHGLSLEFEVDALRGWAEGRTARSWTGVLTTRLANEAKWRRQRESKAPVQRGGRLKLGDSNLLEGTK
ncbi:MAG TPA: hypothetical protein VFK05_19160 [Polyangiaceae bacterium]|nr:hypothetical protein [Polyangiaceae bacterium]